MKDSREVSAQAKDLIIAADGKPVSIDELRYKLYLNVIETERLGKTLARHAGLIGAVIERVPRTRGVYRSLIMMDDSPKRVVEVPRQSPFEKTVSKALTALVLEALEDGVIEYPKGTKEVDEFHKAILARYGIRYNTNKFDTEKTYSRIIGRQAKKVC